jgi:hypothetical protein
MILINEVQRMHRFGKLNIKFRHIILLKHIFAKKKDLPKEYNISQLYETLIAIRALQMVLLWTSGVTDIKAKHNQKNSTRT